MNTVLFAPGYNEGLSDRNYRATLSTIESKGFNAEFVPLRWSRTTPTDWAEEFEITYDKHDPEDIILAGFSYGAIAALLAACSRNPKQLWLFSLSPRFHEDLSKLPEKTIKQFGKRRLEVFNNLHFTSLAKSIGCKTLIFIGGVEAEKDPQLLARAQAADRDIADSILIFMPHVPHDVTDELYLEAIETNIA